MALQRDTLYPNRFLAATPAQPQGAFKNRTSPTAQDGSYPEQKWLNDWSALFSSLLTEADIEANGNVDAVGDSQYFTALSKIITTAVGKAEMITSASGASKVMFDAGDNAIVSSGGSSSLIVTDGERSIGGRSGYKFFNGGGGAAAILLQWVTIARVGSGSTKVETVNFPIPFPTKCLTLMSSKSSSIGGVDVGATVLSPSQFQVGWTSTAGENREFSFFAVGV